MGWDGMAWHGMAWHSIAQHSINSNRIVRSQRTTVSGFAYFLWIIIFFIPIEHACQPISDFASHPQITFKGLFLTKGNHLRVFSHFDNQLSSFYACLALDLQDLGHLMVFMSCAIFKMPVLWFPFLFIICEYKLLLSSHITAISQKDNHHV